MSLIRHICTSLLSTHVAEMSVVKSTESPRRVPLAESRRSTAEENEKSIKIEDGHFLITKDDFRVDEEKYQKGGIHDGFNFPRRVRIGIGIEVEEYLFYDIIGGGGNGKVAKYLEKNSARSIVVKAIDEDVYRDESHGLTERAAPELFAGDLEDCADCFVKTYRPAPKSVVAYHCTTIDEDEDGMCGFVIVKETENKDFKKWESMFGGCSSNALSVYTVMESADGALSDPSKTITPDMFKVIFDMMMKTQGCLMEKGYLYKDMKIDQILYRKDRLFFGDLGNVCKLNDTPCEYGFFIPPECKKKHTIELKPVEYNGRSYEQFDYKYLRAMEEKITVEGVAWQGAVMMMQAYLKGVVGYDQDEVNSFSMKLGYHQDWKKTIQAINTAVGVLLQDATIKEKIIKAWIISNISPKPEERSGFEI